MAEKGLEEVCTINQDVTDAKTRDGVCGYDNGVETKGETSEILTRKEAE